MKRSLLASLVILGFAACEPAIPNSGITEDMDQRLRDAMLEGLPPPTEVQEETLEPVNTTGAPLSATTPAVSPDNPGLSDENNFQAVAERQSIESDAERLERNRSLYKVIEPTDVPNRPGSNVPNIVLYALQTSNPVGEPLYNRAFASQSRFDRNCARFQSSTEAQEQFLIKGGPKRDSLGIDPDGDGFACRWDPTPFRQAVQQ